MKCSLLIALAAGAVLGTPGISPTTVSDDKSYDYIIVGAGLTGSTVAARLANNTGKKILVIEAGKASGQDAEPNAANPLNKIACRDENDVCYPAEPPFWRDGYDNVIKKLMAENGGNVNVTFFDIPGTYSPLPCWTFPCEYVWPKAKRVAKVVGGGDALNGALAQRPKELMWDSWNITGWNSAAMDPYYNEVEEHFHITNRPSADNTLYLGEYAIFLNETFGNASFQWRDDGSYKPSDLSMGNPSVRAQRSGTRRAGQRQSTANRYLKLALETKGSITLWRSSTVTKVNINEIGIATSVAVTVPSGEVKTVSLTSGGTIILAAGAVFSPMLLTASGIGNDTVGASDHAVWTAEFDTTNLKLPVFNPLNPSEDDIARFVRNGTGPLAQFGPIFTAYTGTRGGKQGDLVEVFVSPSAHSNSLTVYFTDMSTNWTGAANVQKTYAMVRDALQKKGVANTKPAVTLGSANHWAASCPLGKCVDESTLLVKGARNVAVVDASVLPDQVWGHPSITLIAVALKAGDILSRTYAAQEMARPSKPTSDIAQSFFAVDVVV